MATTDVTRHDTPALIVVTGAPAAGKTTLARALANQLGLPLAEKDVLKEILFDTLGAGDVEWSKRLGRATYPLLLSFARTQLAAGLSCLLEANFSRGSAEPGFRTLPPHRLVQLVCSAPLDLVLARHRDRVECRERHPGHVDADREGEVLAAIRSGRHEALDLAGEVIEVDASEPVDVEGLAARILTLSS